MHFELQSIPRLRRSFLKGFLGGTAILTASSGYAKEKPGSPIHRVVFQVDSNDETLMKHAVGGAVNISHNYGQLNEPYAVEIVANAAGIAMFRSDISPVGETLSMLRKAIPTLRLSMCGSSKVIAEQKEGRELPLIDGVVVVPFGVVRLVELQEKGWSYIHA
ncbi:hypothetical protein G6M50_22835 [Agrobacterium rhizogenes]|jgi:intracellular sulfur oxidation DsrE/DsrF family protein|uniref:Sulfur reduction protein DsrE n=2 Tax=unclassified Rhizobium TaxID=2613769 RepID=A0AAU7SM65_9HYPH|nr:hypothetical protein [Rhizobium rhizogenes]NTJ80634.1 hypothetical protein [Rhizobium rhizogenes]